MVTQHDDYGNSGFLTTCHKQMYVGVCYKLFGHKITIVYNYTFDLPYVNNIWIIFREEIM